MVIPYDHTRNAMLVKDLIKMPLNKVLRSNVNITPTATMELGKQQSTKFYSDYTNAGLKNVNKQLCKSRSEPGDTTVNMAIDDGFSSLGFRIDQTKRSFKEAVEALNFTASQLYTKFLCCLSGIDLNLWNCVAETEKFSKP